MSGLHKEAAEVAATENIDKLIASQKAKNEKIRNQLYHAALCNKPKVVTTLYSKGLLNKEAGKEALCYAAKFDSVDVARTLIECGVSPSCCGEIDSMPQKKVTPYDVAIEYSSEKVVKLLIRHGVNPNASDDEGCDPLARLLEKTKLSLSDESIIDTLIDATEFCFLSSAPPPITFAENHPRMIHQDLSASPTESDDDWEIVHKSLKSPTRI